MLERVSYVNTKFSRILSPGEASEAVVSNLDYRLIFFLTGFPFLSYSHLALRGPGGNTDSSSELKPVVTPGTKITPVREIGAKTFENK